MAGLKKKATLPKMAVTSSVLENEVGQADFNFKTQASQTLRELQNAWKGNNPKIHYSPFLIESTTQNLSQ